MIYRINLDDFYFHIESSHSIKNYLFFYKFKFHFSNSMEFCCLVITIFQMEFLFSYFCFFNSKNYFYLFNLDLIRNEFYRTFYFIWFIFMTGFFYLLNILKLSLQWFLIRIDIIHLNIWLKYELPDFLDFHCNWIYRLLLNDLYMGFFC